MLIIGVTCTVKEMESLNARKERYLREAIPEYITGDMLREIKGEGKTEAYNSQL